MARSFINDTNGIILQQSSGDANAPTSITRQIVANGQVYGSYGFTQPSGTLTNPAINFNNLPPGMVLSASTYDASFQPINSGYPTASVGSYLVQTGDTLQSIAQSAYGDRQLWFVIAQANGLMSDADLKVGMSLTIPSKVGSVHNTSDTFKPYNPGELIGDTAPTLPVPVPQNDDDGCGALGIIIMVVVAVVVTVATSGAAAGVWGSVLGAGSTAATVAGAATAAALGSIASQVVGNALGIVDGFSWKAVALAAIGGGVGAGVDAAFGGAVNASTTLGQTVLRAVIKNAVTQGIGVATGLQDSFDWRGVAAAGVGAGVGYAITDSIMGAEQAGPTRSGETLPRIGGLVQDWGGGAGARFAGAALVGLAAGTAASLARGGRVSITQVATDVFGNLIGGSLADSMQPAAPALQGVGPYSSRDYRNGMDMDSDNANATNNPPAYTGGNDFANDVARRKQENAWWNNAASGKDKQIEEVSKPEDSSTAAIRNEPPAPRSVRAGDFGGSLERIARSELGSGASQREINNYVGQLFEINGISNARRIGADQGILLPGADTPNATSGLSQYGKDIVVGERIKEQARAEAEFKRQQAAQQAQSSTSQGMSNDEAYAMYMASGGRSGSYARAMGAAYVAPAMVERPIYTAMGDLAGTEMVAVDNRPQMGYGQQMSNVGRFLTETPMGVLQQIVDNPRESLGYAAQGAIGELKGLVNGVPVMATQAAIGYRYLAAGAAEITGLASPGTLNRQIAQYGDFSGAPLEYSNMSQSIGGAFGEGFSPNAYAKGIQLGTGALNAVGGVVSEVVASVVAPRIGTGSSAGIGYDISKWGEYGLPSDGYFARTLTPAQYRELASGREFSFGGKPVADYPGGMGFISSAEEARSLTTIKSYRDGLQLSYDPKYVLEFQLRDPGGLQNVIRAPYAEFVPGGKTGAGFSEWNYPGISSSNIVNPKVRVLK